MWICWPNEIWERIGELRRESQYLYFEHLFPVSDCRSCLLQGLLTPAAQTSDFAMRAAPPATRCSATCISKTLDSHLRGCVAIIRSPAGRVCRVWPDWLPLPDSAGSRRQCMLLLPAPPRIWSSAWPEVRHGEFPIPGWLVEIFPLVRVVRPLSELEAWWNECRAGKGKRRAAKWQAHGIASQDGEEIGSRQGWCVPRRPMRTTVLDHIRCQRHGLHHESAEDRHPWKGGPAPVSRRGKIRA